MTIRNLEFLLKPKSVALIGATDRVGSIGNTVARNLRTGGFKGRIDFVNAHHRTVEGMACHASIGALPEVPDLAVVATPPATIPGIAAELSARGTRAIVIISAGVTPQLRAEILEAGREHCVRVLGPNCIGLLVPPLGLNASFAHRSTKPGKLAFLSQSGALVTAVIDWAASRDIGFSHVVSLGDMSDVDIGDLLDYLAGDPGCTAVLMYLEGIAHAAKFMSAARRTARVKPVIAIKSGRHADAARAAKSHTGALAGSDAAYSAAFHRAGVLRVRELEDLFAAAEMIAKSPALKGERLTILTNGGGAGVLAADNLADWNGTLATLSPATIAALSAVLPPTWSNGNPVDIIGDADGARYEKALEVLLADRDSDALLVIDCPTALSSGTDIANAVLRVVPQGAGGKTVLTNWLGAEAAAPARQLFDARGIPTFETPAAAINGFMQLVRHKRAQEALMRTPPAADEQRPVDRAAADAIIQAALAAKRLVLSEPEGKALLAAYGIPVVETRIAENPAKAAAIARELLLGCDAIALKILSDDISHKSDVGGVRLGLDSAAAVESAAKDMLQRLQKSHPEARIRGFTVSPFIQKPRAHELILGINEDQTFGPLVLFGAGGVSVEVMKDTALALPPLDMELAHNLMAQTQIYRLLQGYRDRPRADLDAIANALVRLCALAANHEEIRELDINPLLADENGCMALDARVRIAGPDAPPRVAMAIRPYPSQWQRNIEVPGIGVLFIRPIRPEDETLYAAFFDKVTMEDRRLRLFTPMAHFTHGFLARLTQIDYGREIAFVALKPDTGELLGVVRFFADPDYREAEFAILVRSDLKGLGLGWRLMQLLVEYAKAERLEALVGSVLEDNTTMLAMCHELGFTSQLAVEDRGVWQVRLDLRHEKPV